MIDVTAPQGDMAYWDEKRQEIRESAILALAEYQDADPAAQPKANSKKRTAPLKNGSGDEDEKSDISGGFTRLCVTLL